MANLMYKISQEPKRYYWTSPSTSRFISAKECQGSFCLMNLEKSDGFYLPTQQTTESFFTPKYDGGLIRVDAIF